VEILREFRRQKGWSQKDLADASGVGQDTISGIERGQHEPRPSTLRKLAESLGVEVADFFREPALLGKADAPRETGPEEERSSEAPSPPPQLETEADEERRVVSQSADSLQRYIDDIKGFKELREAQMEDIERGVESRALVIQMELADKGLRDLLKELGTLDFVEAVTAGREMADPKAIPLSHELLRRLTELEALSAEARASSEVVSSDIYVEGVKGTAEFERRMQEGTLEPRGTES
jgi:transcriptional regulator with XRE-family HTH domain